MSSSTASDHTIATDHWRKRIARAEELGSQYAFATEILRFYITIARFQERVYGLIKDGRIGPTESGVPAFAQPLSAKVVAQFEPFLFLVEQHAPLLLRQAARELIDRGRDSHFQLLTSFWSGKIGTLPSGSDDFVARAFLQPLAEYCRSRSPDPIGHTPYICPYCKRKPGLGVLRPLGDGGQRSLVCSFCLAEWEFRRIICPACGEEDHAKLPVYTAEELNHVRVEACDSCRSFIKTVDLTKTGLANPVVDEMAAVPLDLWAEEHGYTKIQRNLLQL